MQGIPQDKIDYSYKLKYMYIILEPFLMLIGIFEVCILLHNKVKKVWWTMGEGSDAHIAMYINAFAVFYCLTGTILILIFKKNHNMYY